MKDPGPVSQNLTFSVWLKKNIPFILLCGYLILREKIFNCIKTRYQGSFCSGRCIYRILVYSGNSSSVYLYLGYVDDVKWSLLFDPGGKWVVQGFMAPWGNSNDLSGHLLSPIFKVMVKWPYWRVSLVKLSRQDHMLKNLCIVFKIEEYPCSEASLVVRVVFCVLCVTQAYSICTKKSLSGEACCYGGKNILKLISLGVYFCFMFSLLLAFPLSIE